jgi:hypothetical protein
MSDHDLWQVKLSEGCVVEMTLDEIDTAFNAGRINARTSVLPPGDFRWTTLGDAAGLEDDDRPTEPAPYSIAPVAADIGADFASTPPPPMVDLDYDVDLSSAAGVPKKGSLFGKVVGVGLLFTVLVALGIGGGAYAARPAEFKAKVASVKDRFTKGSSGAKAAAAAQPPPPVQTQAAPPPPPPVQSSREIPPPPAAETAAPVPTMHASATGTSVSNLPDAKASKKAAAKKKR